MRQTRWLVGCVAALAVGTTVGAPAAVAATRSTGKPTAQTEAAKRTSHGFKLRGELNPDGLPSTYYFIYKESSAVECEDLEGCGPETPRQGPVTGSRERRVSSEVTNLKAATTYIFWLIARNANGTAVGRQLTFTTPG
jgi:hypothetical protein